MKEVLKAMLRPIGSAWRRMWREKKTSTLLLASLLALTGCALIVLTDSYPPSDLVSQGSTGMAVTCMLSVAAIQHLAWRSQAHEQSLLVFLVCALVPQIVGLSLVGWLLTLPHSVTTTDILYSAVTYVVAVTAWVVAMLGHDWLRERMRLRSEAVEV